MNRINSALRAAYNKLALPQPIRSRVLLELWGDMDDMRHLYIDRGMSNDEAEERVLERFDLSDGALAELAKIHCRPMRRLLDQLSFQARGILERLILIFLAVLSLVILIRGMMTQRILIEAGPFAWPVLAALFAAILSTVIKIYKLYIIQDHRPRSIRRLLHLPLGLAGVGLALGFLGMYGHIFSAWVTRSDTIESIRHLVAAVYRSAGLLTVAMSTSLLSALVWFVTADRVLRIEEHEAAFRFGADYGHTDSNTSSIQ